MYSTFFRLLIRKAKENKTGVPKLDFRNYSKEIIKVSSIFLQFYVTLNLGLIQLLIKFEFKIFFDMVYQVNQKELGMNDLLQLVELTHGEG